MLFRLFFAFFILVHGLIHAMGFAKAFGYGEKLPLSRSISKPAGAVWLLTMFLFVVAAVLVVFQVSWWWTIGLLAAVMSQILLFTAWKDARFGTIANMIILLGTILAFGAWSFERQYQKDVKSRAGQDGQLPIGAHSGSRPSTVAPSCTKLPPQGWGVGQTQSAVFHPGV
ncbi:MAG: hypothetical protein IPN74_07460 [Haliscomenobacter sp.]|nr:hypothetical protein [Haliscomenobacter sp.]